MIGCEHKIHQINTEYMVDSFLALKDDIPQIVYTSLCDIMRIVQIPANFVIQNEEVTIIWLEHCVACTINLENIFIRYTPEEEGQKISSLDENSRSVAANQILEHIKKEKQFEQDYYGDKVIDEYKEIYLKQGEPGTTQ